MQQGRWIIRLSCLIIVALLLGCAQAEHLAPLPAAAGSSGRRSVGFDLDDTLLFSTPAFEKGFKSGHAAFSRRFWITVNQSDRHNSVVKKAATALLETHRAKGDEIYIITARRRYGTDPLLSYLEEVFCIPADHVFFEPEGKKKRIEALKLDIYYGDSDSDISAAVAAGCKGVRILRSPASWYKEKYHPGKYGEAIIEQSAE